MFEMKQETGKEQFQVGDLVQVRKGVCDPDVPQLPLGGWVGTVTELDESDDGLPLCLVEWSEETLAVADPIYALVADRNGLELEDIWLTPSDLEECQGPGGPLEPPPEEFVKSYRDRDERILALVGDLVDEATDEALMEQLRRWHERLTEGLPFPFPTRRMLDVDRQLPEVIVERIVLPDNSRLFEFGLLAECRVGESVEIKPLCSLVPVGPLAGNELLGDHMMWFLTWFVPNTDWGEVDEEDRDDDGDEDLEDEFDEDDAEDWLDERGLVWDSAAAMRAAAEGPAFEPAAFSREEPLRRETPKVGRNDPCPCGSGLKFKKCCLKRGG